MKNHTDRRVSVSSPAASIMLPVPQILQNPELPNGCEITSCCEVLSFMGFDADKCELAYRYLPRSETWYGANPDLVYMGDPGREDDSPMCGFYCFAGPVAEAANRFIKDKAPGVSGSHTYPGRPAGAGLIRAVDITGAGQQELERHLMAGRPFIFWASLHFDDIGYDPRGGFTLADGRYHRLFKGLHCMVCAGMDDTFFYIADPLDYNRKVRKDRFMEVYRQLGSRAVVFL